MIEVTINNKYATNIVDIVHQLKETGLAQGGDFEFVYHKGEWDGMTGLGHYKRHTIFRFKDPAVASWFSLKYNDEI